MADVLSVFGDSVTYASNPNEWRSLVVFSDINDNSVVVLIMTAAAM